MISVLDIKTKSISDELPLPNQFFLIELRKHSGGSFWPAILQDYCDHQTFISKCIILNKVGGSENLQKFCEKYRFGIAGWAHMFNTGESFKITKIQNENS